ncbi:MAG: hypothetical protein GY765_15000 [bacterium]|nr:hypothetical protein [bacterium]
MRKLMQKLNLSLLQEKEKPLRISLLINALYYFIESVLIVEDKGKFRLIAIHRGRLLADQSYSTAKGAKIAFLKFFSYKAWREGTRAEWTSFYPPESKWLDEKLPEKNENLSQTT